jgi:hypothetical protein
MTGARNLGRFTVTGCLLRSGSYTALAKLFDGVVVLDVRHDWMSECTEFMALHADFADVPEGSVVPEYRALFDDVSGQTRWEPL